MQIRAVDAHPGDAVVPVLGDGHAGEDGREEAEEAVRRQPDDESEEDALRALLREDALALKQNGELDGEVGEAVGDDGGIEGLEKLRNIDRDDLITKTVSDLCELASSDGQD